MAEQRYQAVLAVIADGLTVTQAAEKVGVSRQTMHAWLARYEAEGLEGLVDRSHRPVSCPHQMTSLVEVEVARLRQRHPSWGPRRIAFELAGRVSDCGFETPPCVRVSLTAGGRTLGMARRETTDWFVAAESREVAEARAKIARQVRDLPVDAVETVVLLASELITNAVRHGVGPVWVRLSRTDDSIRVEVRDQSRDLPSMQPDDPTALGGRGLRLVNALSSSWGVVGRQVGKSVWFTFDA